MIFDNRRDITRKLKRPIAASEILVNFVAFQLPFPSCSLIQITVPVACRNDFNILFCFYNLSKMHRS